MSLPRNAPLKGKRDWQPFVSKRVIHRAVTPSHMENMRWVDKVELREVKLMVVHQCWAMVRRPHCMPYVCHVDELRTCDER